MEHSAVQCQTQHRAETLDFEKHSILGNAPLMCEIHSILGNGPLMHEIHSNLGNAPFNA